MDTKTSLGEPEAVRSIARNGTAAVGCAALAQALDQVAEAVVFLDCAGHALCANRAAMELFRRESGITLSHEGRIIIAYATAREAFTRALLQLQGGGAAQQGESISLPRPVAGPLILTLKPLSGASAAAALLFITDPGTKPRDNSATLRSAYGLSPAEARLAQALSEGMSLKQVAQRDDLSYETVRSYVKRVLDKTGARRQADFVRLAGALR